MLQSHQAILYDVHAGAIGIEVKQINDFAIETYSASLVQFQISSLFLTILNVQPPGKFPWDSTQIQEIIDREDPLLILGDFSNLTNDLNDSMHKIKHLEAILPFKANTTYSNLKLKYSDNIFVNTSARTFLTGLWGVVRQGLTHLAIPNGWNWGGPVSPHCPLWTELYIGRIKQYGSL
ncbi:hypothetical protein AMK59_3465 [Oryctes borbonicus]|uniref:Endonuclease/exonuclease/phosphatase domain-containing protein n=1 Tax=Oryctes borbonicus TaxID=1629725 RepID=A0A0T6B624_9SCAR|nr:hypothetical protein AMK59_3465 [Oryctes borbonicus]